ncbi:hypothetical protein HY991_04750 [Candidatus Micrarchaeota archaeon]|nr:hypothetical protein [Candidatus Micrarchaeota archaeon]
MGKTKGHYLRVIAKALQEKYLGAFSEDYKTNHEKLKELGMLSYSKEARHKLAGEIVVEIRKAHKREEEE